MSASNALLYALIILLGLDMGLIDLVIAEGIVTGLLIAAIVIEWKNLTKKQNESQRRKQPRSGG